MIVPVGSYPMDGRYVVDVTYPIKIYDIKFVVSNVSIENVDIINQSILSMLALKRISGCLHTKQSQRVWKAPLVCCSSCLPYFMFYTRLLFLHDRMLLYLHFLWAVDHTINHTIQTNRQIPLRMAI